MSATELEKNDAATTEAAFAVTGQPKIVAENPEVPAVPGKDWYILKVQVGREAKIKEGLEQRIKISRFKDLFDRILVPEEKIAVIRNGKQTTKKQKLYPGYIMIRMSVTEDSWMLVRESPGVGDFVGTAGKNGKMGMPTPMNVHEVQKMLALEETNPTNAPKLQIRYEVGQSVKIKDGSFESCEGVVDIIDTTSGRVTVTLNLFGRSTPVELEYWQIEQAG